MCGNGIRCVAKYVYDHGIAKKPRLTIETGHGVLTLDLTVTHDEVSKVRVDMGEPILQGSDIPTTSKAERVVNQRIQVSKGCEYVTCVSMGNPHFVIFVDSFQEGWQRQAALIATQPAFPQGTNVEYVVVRGPNEIEIRLFERGVGETMSSGTGSCASAVAAIGSKRVASPVSVMAPGGTQTVRWEGKVFLLGPATLVCRGEFFV